MLEKLSHILFSSRVLLPDLLFGLVFLVIVAAITFLQKFDNERIYVLFNVLIISILLSVSCVFYTFWGFYKQYFESGSVLFGQLIYLDSTSLFFKLIIAISAVAVLIHVLVVGYKVVGEFYAIFLALVWGLFIMTMTTNWLMLYVSLEMVSICSYILVVFNKGKNNTEAGIKYLLFGATSSAVMLYGISLLYGMTGTLNFVGQEFATFLSQNPTWVAQIAVFMTIGGLLFKLSAAPFHSWTPDVYEATPTPIVAFLSIAPKAAVILVLIRFYSYLAIDFKLLLSVIIMASITIGNLSALWQTNTKRLLGYSTIAHAGFMLVGLLATSEIGVKSAIFYVATYGFITLAAFLLIDLLALKTESYELESLRGLGQENIFLGLAAVVVMIALVGLPPTVGFTGKLLIFTALWESYQTSKSILLMIVLIFGLLNTAISIFFYIKIPYYMIFKEPKIGVRYYQIGIVRKGVLFVFLFFIIYLFINPSSLLNLIEGL
ncbi:NAD(P)H-quinone oxidoreductase subunit 2 [Emticicia oligotrophica DSM 17448]|uniref:NADH-quinone oxidoreductase subunit N n=1 Tax=Emticicia oligotrophica (strain DSM 17448 / CIP 109782 / MTCC 6937 / GPTSA100-15) TaxID=929562 RepID=A0ABM5N562_EMTOG|nr:NADH-quinone oxidoreductase subunit N [Emticicia oligotrophica]AFK04589.1 NAD(P)H-quinone oxidoreductase subunit 2 [Emticicia oligotrophica DSM 17448]